METNAFGFTESGAIGVTGATGSTGATGATGSTGAGIVFIATDPRLGVGYPSPISTIASAIDGSGSFTKVGILDTDWIISTEIINVQSISSTAVMTPVGNINDAISITAQAVALFVANPSGLVPQNFKVLKFRIKDNGTSRAIAWDTQYIAMGVDLPLATVPNKILTIAFLYDSVSLKYGCVAVAQEV